MSQFAVQHVRFFRPTTQPIHCMVYDAYSNRLAISRSDGLLEVYGYHTTGVMFTYDFALPLLLNGDDSSTSIEALTWYNGRLFSAGINGFVVEYDLERLAVARSLSLDSGSIWAMAATTSSETGGGLLACGCDSGSIYLVNLLIADGSIASENALELSGPPLSHDSGRTLSLAWVSNDKYLVSGGMGSIIVWKVSGSRRKILWQMGLPKTVIVWSLVAYPAQQPIFASSDSRGIVSIWDAKNGTLISELSTHHLDVLTLTVGTIGNHCPIIFASGADPTVVSVLPTSSDNLTNVDSWLTAEIHKDHEHDVRASCFVAPDLLLTAGMDRSVVVSRINTVYDKRVGGRATFLCRLMPVLNWANFVSVERISSTQTVLAFSQLSTDGNHAVEIWQLLGTRQDYENEDDSNNKEEKRDPSRQLVIKMPCRLPPQVVKLSPLANFLAFAAGSVLRVFKLDIRAPSASKHFAINFEPTRRKDPAPMVTAIAYCNESSKAPVLGLSADGQLAVQSLWHPELAKKYDLSDDFSAENSGSDSGALPTLFLRVSDDENDKSFCVAIGSRTLVQLYKLSIEEDRDDAFCVERLCRLPSYTNGWITAMSLYPSRLVLIAFSDRRIGEFDGNSQRYTKWTRRTLVGASKKSSKSKAKRQKVDETEQKSPKIVEETEVAKAYPYLWLQQQETIDWVGYASDSQTKILTASSRLLATIDKTAPLPMRIEGPLFKPPSFLQHNRHSPTSPDPHHPIAIQHLSRFRYILAFDCLKPLENSSENGAENDTDQVLPGELFLAELPSGELRAQLPTMVVSKKQFAA